jgi:hypothetical protein
MIQLTSNPHIAILIDAENIRGKTNFELSHSDLLDRLLVWSLLRNHAAGRTIVVIDHGSKPTAHLIHPSNSSDDDTIVERQRQEHGLCITFAGPILKADDVIARDTQWLLNQPDVSQVIVVTNDRELSFRCRHHANPAAGTSKENRKFKKMTRKARKMKVNKFNEQSAGLDQENLSEDLNATASNNTMRVNVVNSKRFLEDMEQTMQQWLNDAQTKQKLSDSAPSNILLLGAQDGIESTATVDGKWRNLYELRSQILHLESCLRKKCTVRKRQQLTQEIRRCKEQWEMGLSSVNSADENGTVDDGQFNELMRMSLSSSLSLNLSSKSNNPLDCIETEDKKKMLSRWGERRGSPKREATEDRVILAEMVRSQLEAVHDRKHEELDEEHPLLVELYADYINNLIKN